MSAIPESCAHCLFQQSSADWPHCHGHSVTQNRVPSTYSGCHWKQPRTTWGQKGSTEPTDGSKDNTRGSWYHDCATGITCANWKSPGCSRWHRRLCSFATLLSPGQHKMSCFYGFTNPWPSYLGHQRHNGKTPEHQLPKPLKQIWPEHTFKLQFGDVPWTHAPQQWTQLVMDGQEKELPVVRLCQLLFQLTPWWPHLICWTWSSALAKVRLHAKLRDAAAKNPVWHAVHSVHVRVGVCAKMIWINMSWMILMTESKLARNWSNVLEITKFDISFLAIKAQFFICL